MATDLTPEEKRVQSWLEQRGYATDHELTFIPNGKERPDFLALCENCDPPGLWAEVKKIDEDASTKALSMANKIAKTKPMPSSLRGQAVLALDENTREQSVRSVLRMFLEIAPKHANEKTVLAFVQRRSDDRTLSYAEFPGEDRCRVWCKCSPGDLIACPPTFCRDRVFGDVTYWSGDSKPATARAFEVMDWAGKYQCSITAFLDPAGRPITSLGMHSHGSSSFPPKSITRALEKANSQLRAGSNAQKFAGIVFFVPQHDYVPDLAIQAACYGDLTVSIDVEQGKNSDTYHGKNGVFRPTKNRHISAVIRLWNSGEATYFLNSHAEMPILEGARLFDGVKRADVTIS